MEYKELGEKIKRRRRFLQMTQTDLSELSEVGLRNLKDLESGKGNPTVTTLVKILEVLGFQMEIRIKA